MSPRVTVIVVNYNGKALLKRCLGSVIRWTRGVSYEVIVVDNGSTDGSCDMVADCFPHVGRIANQQNVGFAAANNQGLRVAKGDFVLLLNPDTELVNDAITQAVACLEHSNVAGLAGCRLVLPDGSTQQSVRSFPTVWDVFAEACFLYLLFSRSRHLGRYHMLFFDYTRQQEVGWVSGAFLMIGRTVIDRIGYLDERFFMYSEEMDYCLRASRAGLKTLYTPRATVRHFWGGANDVNRRVVLWTHGSQLMYIRKHFRGLSRIVAVLSKLLGVALRVPVYFAVGLVSGNRLMLRKSAYHAIALPKLLLPMWNLVSENTGPPMKWPV